MEEKKSFLITVIRENCFVMGGEKVLWKDCEKISVLMKLHFLHLFTLDLVCHFLVFFWEKDYLKDVLKSSEIITSVEIQDILVRNKARIIYT